MKRVRHLVAVAAVGTAAIAVGSAGDVSAHHRTRVTGAILTGRQEAPGPGDPDGAGLAAVTINVARGRICYALAVTRIAPATLAHIHRGARGVPGPIVVHLDAPTDGSSANCTLVDDPALVAEIAHAPSAFYVNVHNADFQAGAIRGQLR
jgi:hypothetical protein